MQNCSSVDPVTGEKVLIEPNPDKRAREFADKGGGIFGNLGKIGANKPGGAVDFESSNVLWKATLRSADQMGQQEHWAIITSIPVSVALLSSY